LKLCQKKTTLGRDGDVVDENLVGSVIKSLHPWLSNIGNNYFIFCQMNF